jgi:hypothetical protein
MTRNDVFAIAAVAVAMLFFSALALANHEPMKMDAIDGNWEITFTIQSQTVSGQMMFHTEGEKLTGTLETSHTGHGTVQNGKWASNTLSATCVFEKHESIALSGKFDHGKLSGTFRTEGREGTWEAMRAASTMSKSRQYAPYAFRIGA